MRTLARRVGAGLKACWVMQGTSYPRGTYALLFLAACFCVGRSGWTTGRVNALEASMALATGLLMVMAFREGFTRRADEASPRDGAEPK